MSKPAYKDMERSWHVEDPELQSHRAVEERDLEMPRIPHLSPSRRRACVDYVMSELCISERRACRALGQHRSTQRKIATTPGDEVALTADIIELARQYGRYGYRRITALLRRAGWTVNKKRVERIWRSEGLKVRDCQESCVRGHDDGNRRSIIWRSRKTCWTSYWRAAIRRTYSTRTAWSTS